MIQDNQDDFAAKIDATLPVMRERARDQIGLMFLVDDFQRALNLHLMVVTSTVERFTGKLDDDLKAGLELKLTGDLLMIQEMARNMSARGRALIEGAEKVVSKIPPWDIV